MDASGSDSKIEENSLKPISEADGHESYRMMINSLSELWAKAHDLKLSREERLDAWNSGTTLSNLIARSVTRKELQMHGDLLSINLSYFDPINQQYPKDLVHPKIIGIFAYSEFKPKLINEGKFGAGSEKALLELSNELARRGYNVYIFSLADVESHWDLYVSGINPRYLPIQRKCESDLLGPFHVPFIRSFSSIMTQKSKILDVLILWREPGRPHYVFNNYAKRTILWSHDFWAKTDGYNPDYIYVLSQAHKDETMRLLGHSKHDEGKYIIGCNGTSIDLSRTIDYSAKKPFQCCFMSNWSRGLERLLTIWPKIVEAYPEATLKVGYGRQTWGILTEDDTNRIERMMTDLPSVESVGMLPYKEMTQLIEESSFLLFPCHLKAETFSIISAISQQLKTIAVVSRVDALREVVVQKYELVEMDEFLEYTLYLLSLSAAQRLEIANEQYEHAKQYTWAAAADSFEKVFY